MKLAAPTLGCSVPSLIYSISHMFIFVLSTSELCMLALANLIHTQHMLKDPEQMLTPTLHFTIFWGRVYRVKRRKK